MRSFYINIDVNVQSGAVLCSAVAVIILVIDYDSVDCILLAINYAIKIHDHNNDNAFGKCHLREYHTLRQNPFEFNL